MSLDKAEDVVEDLTLHNKGNHSLVVYLEPWGDHLALTPGMNFRIATSGPKDQGLELYLSEDSIQVYGWVGSTLTVSRDGIILRDCKPRVPFLP
jgi:hypothetical protein